MAALGLGALAVRWTPRSSFPLRVLGSSSGWSPREDSSLHCQVRSPEVSCIGLRGGVVCGDQPWDRTTFSRASAERYDHTSSLVEWSRRRESNPRLRLTRAPCLRQHFVDLVQDRGFEPRSPGHRPEVLPVGRSLDELAVGPGLEPGSSRVTGGRVTVATTLQIDDEAGCQTWTRTTICGVRGRRPSAWTIWQLVGSGGLEPPRTCARSRWAAIHPTTRELGVNGRS